MLWYHELFICPLVLSSIYSTLLQCWDLIQIERQYRVLESRPRMCPEAMLDVACFKLHDGAAGHPWSDAGTGRWSPLWTVHTSFWKLQSDVVSTRQWPCCVTYTQHSVGSWASRLRLRVKELTSLSGRSSPLYLKSFSCASMHSAALPAWPTARPPARLVCVSF